VTGSLVVFGLAKGERHISVFDHVLNLSPHFCLVSAIPPFHLMGNLLVRVNRMIQYTTKTGQNTGTLKISNQVQRKPMEIALVALCQNLNSGSRRMKGLNSSSRFIGRGDLASAPSSSASDSFIDGSNLGWRKARKRLRR
jgi:hypothetical protein